MVVNVIGAGGKVASPTHLAGGAANAALMLATAGLAYAYASGVRVVGLNPGVTKTERVAEGLKAEAKRANVSEEQAFKQMVARPADGQARRSPRKSPHRGVRRLGPRALPNGANISTDGAASHVIV